MNNINEIDSMAVNLRKELGEDSMSPIDIFSLAMTMSELTTVLCPLGKNISGMCICHLEDRDFRWLMSFITSDMTQRGQGEFAQLRLMAEMRKSVKLICLHPIFCCHLPLYIMSLRGANRFLLKKWFG